MNWMTITLKTLSEKPQTYSRRKNKYVYYTSEEIKWVKYINKNP